MEWSGWVTKAHIKMFVMANGFVCVCVCVCVCVYVSVCLFVCFSGSHKNCLGEKHAYVVN